MPFFEELEQSEPVKITRKIYSNEQISDAAFAYHRANGFPYPKQPSFILMQELNALASTEGDTLLRTSTGYIVADSYHQHRWHAAAQGMRSPFQSFNIDKSLKAACNLDLKYYDRLGIFPQSLRLVHGTQACSNFRPGFALYVYRKYGKPGGVILDTSTGYGGRLVGFLASEGQKYVGFDPNTVTHAANTKLAQDLAGTKEVCLNNLPIEDAKIEDFENTCDVSFTSPPYFSKEIYSDEPTQSWIRYKTAQEWCKGFLLPMMKFTFAALKPGCLGLINIADVKINGMMYPLVEWTRIAGRKAGFTLIGEQSFMLTTRFGTNDGKVNSEPVLIFKKPE